MAGEARETVTATRTLKLAYPISRLREMPSELLRVLEGSAQLARLRESGDWRAIYSFVWKKGRVRKERLRRRPATLSVPASVNWDRCALVLQLWQRPLELPLSERAMRWLWEKEREVEPLKVHRTVRIQWRPERAQALKVQIILRVQRPRPAQPDPRSALLVYVDVNSSYGIAAIFASFDEGYAKIHETLKLRPPNQTRRLKEAAKRGRAAAHGSKPNVNRALARLTMKFDASGWVKAAAAEIFRKAMKYAKGRSILMNFDVPDSESVKGSRLQRTLLSIKRVAENLANWYGVRVEFRCYPSRRCPLCGGGWKSTELSGRASRAAAAGSARTETTYRSTTGLERWACRCRSTPSHRCRTTRKPEGRRGKPVGGVAIRKPAEMNYSTARARAGLPWAATPRGGAAGRADDGSAGAHRARAKPAASPPCGPPEQVTGGRSARRSRQRAMKGGRGGQKARVLLPARAHGAVAFLVLPAADRARYPLQQLAHVLHVLDVVLAQPPPLDFSRPLLQPSSRLQAHCRQYGVPVLG